jgi:hypothetical protein
LPLTIQKVDLQNRRQVHDFVYFPFHLYRNCPQWVPPLVSEAFAALKPNHFAYQYDEATFFLAKYGKNGNKTVGRLAVIDNKRTNQILGQKIASFFYFDCVDDRQVSRALFENAFAWAHERGLTEINGPRGLTSLDGAGILVKGFEHRAALTMPYNYPYYDAHIQALGFEKTGNSLSGYLPGTYELPKKVELIAEKVKARRGLWIKSFTTKAEMRTWVPRVAEAYIRAGGAGNGYVPPTETDIQAMGEAVIQISEPSLIKLVMSGDEVVGFVFSYHDLSPALQKSHGRLFPIGWIYFILEKRRNNWININGIGLVPEHQRVGGDALLFTELAKSIKSYGFKHADIVAVGEDNFASRSDLEALGVEWYKAHRTYRKTLEGVNL